MILNSFLKKSNRLINVRGKLIKVKNNYYSGQELLKKILLGEPDYRLTIYINDLIRKRGK